MSNHWKEKIIYNIRPQWLRKRIMRWSLKRLHKRVMDGIRNRKDFKATFAWINELETAKIITVQNHAFIPKDCPVRKEKRDFKMEFTATGIYHALCEANEQGVLPFHFLVWGKEYILTDGGCHISHSKSSIFPDISDCTLSLTAFCSNDFDNSKGYYRYITKISNGENTGCFHRIQSLTFAVGKTIYGSQLFAINLAEGEVQVGYATDKGNGDRYFFIEPQFKCTADYLQGISYPIVISLGLLRGWVYLNDCYILQYEDAAMFTPIALTYRSWSESYRYEYPIFASNPYPFVERAMKNLCPAVDKDKFEDILHQEVKKYNGFISMKVFSQLVQNFINYDDLLRAAHTMMVSCHSTLEAQPATCAVALETITGFIAKENGLKAPNVVRDDVWKETSKVFKEIIATQLGSGQMTKDEHDFIAKKLQYINQPTNRDKLSLPFQHVGYTLTQEEVKAIQYRNTLLHGSIGTDFKDIKKASDKLLLDTLMLHRLCGILLLKLAGYSGPIINYAKMYGLDCSHDMKDIFLEI